MPLSEPPSNPRDALHPLGQTGEVRDAKTVERALEDIAALLSFSAKGRFKAQAYERGAEIVAGLSFELGKTIEAGRLTDIEGIGESLSKQILELWSTGRSSLLERLRAENPPGAAELIRVPGMTAKRIQALSTGLGVDSIATLRAACEAQRVRELPGFGEKTEQRLLGGVLELERAETREPRILLSDGMQLFGTLERALTTAPFVERVELAGAARRGEEILDELIILVVLGDLADAERTWELLAKLPMVVRVDRALGLALLTDGIALRPHLTTAACAGSALLSATGPTAHLQALRARAEQRGMAHGKDGTALALGPLSSEPDEASVYRRLALPLIPAELRRGALDGAERDDFSNLVSARDVLGAVHCHTTHSDGKNTIEEMAQAAKALGFQYITITDHSPSAYYARGVTLERLQRQWDEIREAEQRVGIRILRGTESDILADGSLDYPDDVLQQFDVVIASIHSRFRMSRADMTARLTRAMQLPVFKIWGHALGRLLLSREPIDCDVEAVLDALASAKGAIEINGDPHRLDLPPQYIEPARARGIPFVLSLDAHSTRGLGVLPFAVQMARRGGLRRHEVLNTLSADAFVARVRGASVTA